MRVLNCAARPLPGGVPSSGGCEAASGRVAERAATLRAAGGGYCAADWRQPCGTIVLNALRVRGGYEAASCCGSGQGYCRGSDTGGTVRQALHGPELGSGGMGLAARGSPHRGTRAPAWGELPRARAAVLPRRLLSLRGQCAGQGAAGPPLPGKRDLCAGIARAEVQGLMAAAMAAAMAMAAAIAADGLTVTMAAAMAASNYNYTSGHGGGYMAAAMAMAIWLRWRLRRPLTVTMAAATAASNCNYTGGHGGG